MKRSDIWTEISSTFFSKLFKGLKLYEEEQDDYTSSTLNSDAYLPDNSAPLSEVDLSGFYADVSNTVAAHLLIKQHDFSAEQSFPDISEGTAIPPSDAAVYGLGSDGLNIDFGTNAVITYAGSSAGYNNMLGYYAINDDGQIIDANLIFNNSKKLDTGDQVSINIEADTQLNFFIVADGADLNNMNRFSLERGHIEFIYNHGQADERTATIYDQAENISLVYVHNNGKGEFVLKGNIFHASLTDESYENLNIDGLQHAIAGSLDSDDPTTIRIAFEDLLNLGDADYDDLVFDVEIQSVDNPVIVGTNEDDSEIIGTADNDLIYGADGDDIIIGTAGADVVHGGDGVDTLDFSGFGNAVDMRLFTDRGDANGDGIFEQTLLSIENLIGSNYDDELRGDENDNIIYGGLGNDRLTSAGGHDELYGGEGDDSFLGGDDASFYDGGTGEDFIWFRNIETGISFDLRTGTLTHSNGDVSTLVNFEAVQGGLGNDIFIGSDGIDLLNGDDGDDIFHASSGDDQINGGDGEDSVYLEYDLSEYLIEQNTNGTIDITHASGLYGTQNYSNIENFYFGETLIPGEGIGDVIDDRTAPDLKIQLEWDGGVYNDISSEPGTFDITAETIGYDGASGTVVNYVRTSDGQSDILFQNTAPEKSVITGSDQDDTLLIYGEHSDLYLTLNGGDGNDTITVVSDNIFGTTALFGDAGDDILTGNNNDNGIRGGTGNDTLYGLDGDDKLYGEDDNDILYGGDGLDNLQGGNGNDTLYGGADSDQLFGEDGDDILYGGDGVDGLTGGSGADTFVFASSDTGLDVIADFDLAEDILDISDILSGFDSSTDDLSDFVFFNVRNTGNATLKVNADGEGKDWVNVAKVLGADFTGVDVNDLLASGHIVTDSNVI